MLMYVIHALAVILVGSGMKEVLGAHLEALINVDWEEISSLKMLVKEQLCDVVRMQGVILLPY